jgi:multidrug efflux pump subunit AcrB
VSSDSLDEKQLYDLAYNTIEPQLERIQGVASASVGGGKVREIEVMANRNAMRARGSASSISPIPCAPPICCCQAEVCAPGIATTTCSPTRRSPTWGPCATWSCARPRPIRPRQGVVRISDIAKVEDLTADQTEIVRVNGQRGVYLRVLKQPGANTIATVDAVRAAIPKLRSVPANVKMNISFDQSSYIRSAVAALQHEAVQGGCWPSS